MLHLRPALLSSALLFSLFACSDPDVAPCVDDSGCFTGAVCVAGACLPGSPDIGAPDVDPDGAPNVDVPADVPGEEADAELSCEPACESLGREACEAGVCGDCMAGLVAASASPASACCAPNEQPTEDGLGCELPPECVGVDCQNGGSCVVVNGVGVCDCEPGTTGPSCETTCETEEIIPLACDVQIPELPTCMGWFDTEVAQIWRGGDCERDPICTTEGEDCEGGCVQVVLGIDLGQSWAIDRVEWRADWWSKRPEQVRIQITDNGELGINDWPTATTTVGQEHPWQCVTGEPCSAEVPDECCPDGRDAPQRIEVDALISKWDTHEFAAVSGRYVAYNIESTYSRNSLIFQDLRLFGSTCLGGLACDPEVENCGEPCGVGEVWNGSECEDDDGCEGSPCFDGVECTDVSAPGTGFDCGPCPEGLEGDGITCVATDCEPECPGWQQCVRGTCEARPCSMGCGTGTCFEGLCEADGVCSELCERAYGSSRVWECDSGGYCMIRDCRRGSECGGGVDCVSDPEGNSRGPGGAGVFDQTCVGGASSPCGGTCDGLCSATSGRCSG